MGAPRYWCVVNLVDLQLAYARNGSTQVLPFSVTAATLLFSTIQYKVTTHQVG